MNNNTQIFTRGIYLHGTLPLEDEGLFLSKLCGVLERPSLFDDLSDKQSLDIKLEQILKYINEYKIPFLCGYSLGGRILQTLLPRLTFTPELIVLMGSALPLENVEDKQERLQKDKERARLIKNDFSSFIDQWYSATIWSLSTDDKAEIISRINSEYSNHKKRKELAEIITYFSPGQYPLTSSYPHSGLKIKSPIIYISGELDTKYVNEAKRFREIDPSISHFIIKNIGHKIHFKALHQEQILQFIKKMKL